MNNLFLIRPTPAHEAQVLDYLAEHRAFGEEQLHGASLLERQASYSAWLQYLTQLEHPNTVPPGFVPCRTRLLLRRADGALLGIASLRLELNDFLRQYAGHIGYGIRPKERGQGYATQLLHQCLLLYRTWGFSRVMLCCDKENLPSARTILANGGVLEREFPLPGSQGPAQAYWIDLTK